MDFQETNKISCVKTSSRRICGTCFTSCIRLTQTHPDAASALPLCLFLMTDVTGPPTVNMTPCFINENYSCWLFLIGYPRNIKYASIVLQKIAQKVAQKSSKC